MQQQDKNILLNFNYTFSTKCNYNLSVINNTIMHQYQRIRWLDVYDTNVDIYKLYLRKKLIESF